MDFDGLLSALFMMAMGIVIIKYRKFPYWFIGKLYFVEGNAAIFLGFVIIIMGFLAYFAFIENL